VGEALDNWVTQSLESGQAPTGRFRATPGLTAVLNAQIAAMRTDGTFAKTLEKNGLDKSAAFVGESNELYPARPAFTDVRPTTGRRR